MTRRTLRRSAVAATSFLLLIGGAAAASAAVANDDIADALVVTASLVDTRTSSGATTEPGEPAPSCHAATGATVWYRVDTSFPSRVTIKTFGSKFDTVLAAYSGAPGALTEIGCNDDAEDFGSQQSLLTVDVGSGQTAYVQAGGFEGASGSLKVTLDLRSVRVGDDFEGAVVVAGLPFTDQADTSAATAEAGEPTSCGEATHSWWYRFTPQQDVVVRASTAGSTYDTMLGLFRGTSLSALELLDCNDDSSADLTSRLVATLTAGSTYHFRVETFFGSPGGDLTFALSTPVPPSNDHFADATSITGIGYATSGDTMAATVEPGEPDACGIDTATVWYALTLPETRTMVARVSSSDWFYPGVGVYTGASLSELTQVACGGYETTFVAEAGTTYYLQVGGSYGERGEYTFDLGMGASVRSLAGAWAVTDGEERHRGGAYVSAPFVLGYGAVERDEEQTGVFACAVAVTGVCTGQSITNP